MAKSGQTVGHCPDRVQRREKTGLRKKGSVQVPHPRAIGPMCAKDGTLPDNHARYVGMIQAQEPRAHWRCMPIMPDRYRRTPALLLC